MSLTYQTLDGETVDRAEVSIARLREFEPPEGYYVAFSGGKDSIVTLDLVRRSGVKHDAEFHLTTVDPRELVAFRRYLCDRGLSSGTITVYASNARVCLNAGVTGPDDVDAAFPDHASTTQHIYRSALRWWASFVRATA